MKRYFRATFVFTGLLLAAIVLLSGVTRQSASALEDPSPAKEAAPIVTEAEVVGERTDDSEPFQTRVFRVPEREPQEVARLLIELFGDKVNVTVDDRSDSIIVRVARAKLASEVEFYLKEIDATVKRLAAEPVANRRLPHPTASVATARPNFDPSDAVMDREAKQLAARVRAAKEPEKSKLRAELELLTDKHFEHRQQQRAAEIKDLADRVDKLRVAHHRRQENKPDILKRRLADLLDEENELKWDDRPANSSALRPTNTARVPSPATIEKAGNDAMWTHFGVRLKRMTTAELDAEKLVYRGGLRVIEVKPVTRKEEIGLRVGDLLVGVHQWELNSFEDVAYIIDKLMKENPQYVKVVFVRDSKEHTISMRWQGSRPNVPTPAPSEPAVNIDGEWLVTLPAGFEFVGKIEKRPEGCWSFQEMRNLSGFYQLEGNTLKGVTTDKKEPRDYEWLILNDNVLVLTKAPQNIGSDYRGATLRRGVKPKKPIERTSLPGFQDDSVSNPETDSPRTAVIRAAHRKAAEARLRLAKFEFDRVVESNRKVPGSVPSSEVEKLKTNVAVAEAELELAVAGVDPREVRTRGIPLSEPVAAAKLQKAEVVLKSARTEFDRMQKLVESKSASSAEVDRVTAQVEQARADVDIAKAELEEARRATQPTPGK